MFETITAWEIEKPRKYRPRVKTNLAFFPESCAEWEGIFPFKIHGISATGFWVTVRPLP